MNYDRMYHIINIFNREVYSRVFIAVIALFTSYIKINNRIPTYFNITCFDIKMYTTRLNKVEL